MTSQVYTLDGIKSIVFGANCIDQLPTKVLKMTDNKEHEPLIIDVDNQGNR